MDTGKTVAALSTPYGRGAIAMIRVTGDDAIKAASAVFVPKNKTPLETAPPGKNVYGEFVYNGEVIDDGMAAIYKSPVSYTGENMAELCCHGGILVSSLVLQALYDAGAAPAEGGEFTKRAFINGKLGLSSAEAIMDIIDAESVSALRLAGGAGKGLLSEEIKGMYDKLKHLIAASYAYIDYPDEDMTDVSAHQLREEINELTEKAKQLKESYKTVKAVCEGIDTVICGAPNVGKSSLLNLLSGSDAAIVTDIAGTTRDIIKTTAVIGQVKLKLSDTAGIRETNDTVEKIGVERARAAYKSSQLIIAVFDGSVTADAETRGMIDDISASGRPVIAVVNKSDIRDTGDYDGIFEDTVHMSALTGEGREQLENLIQQKFISGSIDYDKPHISNMRQYSQICRFLNCCESAAAALDNGMSQDIACLDLEEALAALAELDGLAVSEQIVDEIFSKFCVGK